MPKCKECGKTFGLLELKKGLCKQCTMLEGDAVDDEKARLALSVDEKLKIRGLPFITSDSFVSFRITKTHGMARGSTVRAKHIGRDIMADVKNIVGGEIKGYTELLAEGREEAIYRMKHDAVKLGGNAVVCVRFANSTIGVGATEILAYGTAVTIEKE